MSGFPMLGRLHLNSLQSLLSLPMTLMGELNSFTGRTVPFELQRQLQHAKVCCHSEDGTDMRMVQRQTVQGKQYKKVTPKSCYQPQNSPRCLCHRTSKLTGYIHFHLCYSCCLQPYVRPNAVKPSRSMCQKNPLENSA